MPPHGLSPTPRILRNTLSLAAHCALALTLILSSCRVNPVTDRLEMSFLSEEEEIQAGQEENAMLVDLVGTAGSDAMHAYVERIGHRLAAVSHRPNLDYHFAILDLPEPNAFALPGGFVYVTRGLLAATNSESELACILGHEIGHVAARHAVQQITKTAIYDPFRKLKGFLVGLAAPVRDLTGILAVDIASAVPDLVFAAVLQKYSRDDEREADELGIRYAELAGFDPHGLSTFLLSLQRMAQAQGGVQRASFLDSHPLEKERIRDIDRKLQGHPPREPHRRRYLQRIDGILFGDDPSHGVMTQSGMFFHPSEAWGIRIPDGWQVSRGREGVLALPPGGENALIHVSTMPQEDPPLMARRRTIERLRGASGVSLTILEKEERLISGLPVASLTLRVETSQGAVGLHVSWAELAGETFQVLGIAPLERFESVLETFRHTARSFRGMTEEELDAIPYRRVRLHETRPGETLASIVADAGPGSWTEKELAIWNGLPEGKAPPAAALIKVVRVETEGGAQVETGGGTRVEAGGGTKTSGGVP